MSDAVSLVSAKDILSKAGQSKEKEIKGFIFDHLDTIPTSKHIQLELTPYLLNKQNDYRIRFFRKLNLADVEIKGARLSGHEKGKINDFKVSLSTKYKEEVVNPYVDFIYDESNNKIILKGLSKSDSGQKVWLDLDLELKNPGNQGGDKVSLFATIAPLI